MGQVITTGFELTQDVVKLQSKYEGKELNFTTLQEFFTDIGELIQVLANKPEFAGLSEKLLEAGNNAARVILKFILENLRTIIINNMDTIKKAFDAEKITSVLETLRDVSTTLTGTAVSLIATAASGGAAMPFSPAIQSAIDIAFKMVYALGISQAERVSKLIKDAIAQLPAALNDQITKMKVEGGGRIRGGAYKAVRAYVAKRGGCECMNYSGGNFETFSDYAKSIDSKTKKELVEKIIDLLASLTGNAIKNRDVKEYLEFINKLPLKAFAGEMEKQEAKIRTIAKLVNDSFGNNALDLTQPPAVLAEQLGDIMLALSEDLLAQLDESVLTVGDKLSELNLALRNMKEIQADLKQQIEKSIDPQIITKTTNHLAVMEILIGACEKYISAVANLVNGRISSSKKTAIEMIRELAALKSVDLGRANSTEFAKYIRKLMVGSLITADLAKLIESILTELGVSLEEYGSAAAAKIIDEKFADKLKTVTDADKLIKLEELIKIIKTTLPKKQEVLDVLKVYRGRGEEQQIEDNIVGGDDLEYELTSTDRKILMRKRLRNVLMESFVKTMDNNYDELMSALSTMSAKIGISIPITDELDNFRRLLIQLVDAMQLGRDQEHIYYALTGYYKDALSKSKKEQFMGIFNMLAKSLETLIEMPTYRDHVDYFKSIHAVIRKVLETVDRFSDEFVTKFGADEDADKETEKKLTARVGGDEFEDREVKEEERNNAEISKRLNRSTIRVGDIFRKFDYYYRVAQIRRNLAQSSKMIDSFGEQYEKVVGISTAQKIDDIRKEYKSKHEALDKFMTEWTYEVYKKESGALIEDKFKEEKEKKTTAAKKFLEGQELARVNFWKTTEAIDLLMKSYTENLVKTPDEIKDIKNMLDDIEVISDWYANNSGDNIVEVIDMFNTSGKAKVTAETAGDHYYDKVDKTASHGDDIQNPFVVINPEHDNIDKDSGGLAAVRKLKKAITGVSVLKNIISLFTHIGSKFGKVNLNDKAFMTPMQIYNNLTEYIIWSSVSMGLFDGKASKAMPETVQEWRDALGLTELYDAPDVTKLSFLKPFPEKLRQLDPTLTTPYGFLLSVNNTLGADVFNATEIAAVNTAYQYAAPTPLIQNFVAGGITDVVELTAAGKKNIEKIHDDLKPNIKEITHIYYNGYVIPIDGFASQVEFSSNGAPVSNGDQFDTINVVYIAKTKVGDFYTTLLVKMEVGGTGDVTCISNNTYTDNQVNTIIKSVDSTYYFVADTVKYAVASPKTEFSSKLPSKYLDEESKRANVVIEHMKANPKTLKPEELKELKYYQDKYEKISDKKVEPYKEKIGKDQYINNETDMISLVVSDSSTAYPIFTDKQDCESCFKAQFGVFLRGLVGDADCALRGSKSMQTDDEYFKLVIKSIAAKVLTTVGMYKMLERPESAHVMTPIRLLTGGAGSVPKIEAEMTELHFRLPLLALFYKELFNYDEDATGDNKFTSNSGRFPNKKSTANIKISMLPDIDGVFSGLIDLIFVKINGTSNGSWTDEEIKDIVREVNNIYVRMGDKVKKESIVSDIIQAFVDEINRRYAIVSQDEQNRIDDLNKDRFDYAARTQKYAKQINRKDDYAILPNELESEYETVKSLPSDKYEDSKSNASAESLLNAKKKNYAANIEHKKLIDKFKKIIEDQLLGDNLGKQEYNSYKGAIESAKLKIAKETSDEEKFKILAALIRGNDVYSRADHAKLLGFHEIVINGLNVLSAIHTLLDNFRRSIVQIDVDDMYKRIMKSITIAGAVRGYAPTGGGAYADIIERLHAALTNMNGKQYADIAKEIAKSYHYWDDKAVWDQLLGKNTAKTLQTQTNTAIADYDIPQRFEYGIYGDIENGRANRVYLNRGTGVFSETNEDYIKRYGFDLQYVMKSLIETLYGFGANTHGLVNIKFDKGLNNKTVITLDYSGLKEHIDGMFDSLGYFIDYFRPYLSKDLIEKYTDKYIPGSYFWLYEQIQENFFLDRKGSSKDQHKYINMNKLQKRINSIWEYCTGPFKTAYEYAVNNIVGAYQPTTEATKYNSYDRIFAESIFYDSAINQSYHFGFKPSIKYHQMKYHATPTANTAYGTGATYIDNGPPPPDMIDFRGTEHHLDRLIVNGHGKDAKIDLTYAARHKQLYSFDEEYNLNRSLLLSFNQLLAKYINMVVDVSSGKAYFHTLNEIVNGPLNASILDVKYTWPDTHLALLLRDDKPATAALKTNQIINIEELKNLTIITHKEDSNPAAPGVGNSRLMPLGSTEYLTYTDTTANPNRFAMSIGPRYDPDPRGVLFTSLSIILRNIISTKDSKNANVYLIDTFADVPIYMKEKMRASLPVFKTMFAALVKRAGYIKSILRLDDLSLSADRNSVVNKVLTDVGKKFNNPYAEVVGGPQLLQPTKGEATRTRFTEIVDSIIMAANSVIKACDGVMKELADDPKYFELYRDSIKDFKSLNKSEPLMPLSALSYILKDRKDIKPDTSYNYLEGYLQFANDIDVTRYRYGIRKVFHQLDEPVAADQIYGYNQILDDINQIMPTRSQIPKDRAIDFANKYLNAIRFLYEETQIKAAITSFNYGYNTPPSEYQTSINNKTLNEYIYMHYLRKPLVLKSVGGAGFAYDKNTNTFTNDTIMINNKANQSILYSTNLSDYKASVPKPSYAIQHNLNALINLMSSDKNDAVRKITDYINKETTRIDKMSTTNILDMNIIPININALMREIPFINLYNYAYTFDRLLVDLYLGQYGHEFAKSFLSDIISSNKDSYDINNVFNATSQPAPLLLDRHFTALMIDPYYHKFDENFTLNVNGSLIKEDGTSINQIDPTRQFRIIRQMLSGIAGMELSQPRFIADQIYNKMMFGSWYDHATKDQYYNGRDQLINNSQHLTYLKQDTTNKNITHLQQVDITNVAKVNKLRTIGIMRFDTMLIRNMTFIINVYRTMRYALQRELNYSSEIISKSRDIVNPDNTEFVGVRAPINPKYNNEYNFRANYN